MISLSHFIVLSVFLVPLEKRNITVCRGKPRISFRGGGGIFSTPYRFLRVFFSHIIMKIVPTN